EGRGEEVEPRRVQEYAAAHGARPVRLSVEVGWNRGRDHVALHRRDRAEAGVARGDRRVVESTLRAGLPGARAGQQHHALENRQGRKCYQWPRLRLLRFRCCYGASWGARRSRSRRRMAEDARRPRKNSAAWISRSVPRGTSFLPVAEPPRKARRFTCRRAVSAAMALLA